MTTVRYFHNGMVGAPVLSGTAGAMIAVLDACLVDGWGSGTVDSIVISGGVATVTRAAGHPFDVDSVAELAGATTTGGTINGVQKVLSVSGTTWTFATALANQTATGTITHKVASLGWAKTFSGTNLAVYRSADTAGTRAYLRVDDAAAQDARVVGYEAMTDVNTGSGPFPTAGQASGGLFWGKSQNTSSTARNWTLIGDSRAFVLNAVFTPGSSMNVSFGDFQSNKLVDAHACQITGAPNTPVNSSSSTADVGYLTASSPALGFFLMRGVSGLGGSAPATRNAAIPCGQSGGSWSGASGYGFCAYPNPANNELPLSPIFIGENTPTVCWRGAYVGAYFVSAAIGTSVFPSRERVTGVLGFPNRAFRSMAHGSGPLLVDVTGPWAR